MFASLVAFGQRKGNDIQRVLVVKVAAFQFRMIRVAVCRIGYPPASTSNEALAVFLMFSVGFFCEQAGPFWSLSFLEYFWKLSTNFRLQTIQTRTEVVFFGSQKAATSLLFFDEATWVSLGL